MEIRGRKQKHASPAERDHVWMGAVEKDMLLTKQYSIFKLEVITITQFSSGAGILSPGHCFNS